MEWMLEFGIWSGRSRAMENGSLEIDMDKVYLFWWKWCGVGEK